MTVVRKSSKRPFLVLLAALCAAAAGYWLYTGFFGSQLPVKMNSPAFALQDLNGNTVTQAEFDGKVRLTSFIFTRCPDICPTTTSNMVVLQNKLQQEGLFGSDVAFMSVSFDPVNDTPEVLQQYAERLGIDQNGWTLLRGEETDIKELAAAYGISILRIDDGLYAHSVTSLLLIDGKQQVRRIYKMGEEMDNTAILADIQSLVDERRKES